jgi:amino acid transporter
MLRFALLYLIFLVVAAGLKLLLNVLDASVAVSFAVLGLFVVSVAAAVGLLIDRPDVPDRPSGRDSQDLEVKIG